MIAGRVPHAILIGGPAGVGKTTLALDLTAGLLCDSPDPDERPCRACRACRLVDKGSHPDVHRLAPTGPGDQIRIGSRDRPEDGTVRRLASDLVLLPVEGGARVAIVERADRLTDDAQTALLKTLEEPPAGVTIILCADDEDRLLPTVRSRCARIRLGPVATREIEAILADSGVADPPLAARLARIAGGRPGAARILALAPDALAARDEIARVLLDLLTAPIARRLEATRELATDATNLIRGLDRAAAADRGGEALSGAAAGSGSRSRPRASGRATRAGASRGSIESAPASDSNGSSEPGGSGPPTGTAPADGEAEGESEAGGRGAVPAAERRRAAAVIVGLWRDLTRDLLVARLGDERQVHDPALIDDLRSALGHVTGTEGAAALAGHLARLDAAGELLEANVRPELVIDSLLLHWRAGPR